MSFRRSGSRASTAALVTSESHVAHVARAFQCVPHIDAASLQRRRYTHVLNPRCIIIAVGSENF